MQHTTFSSPPPHHPACTCPLCQLYRVSKPYGEAQCVYDRLHMDDRPQPAQPSRPGDARYLPRKPLLVLMAATITRTQATCTFTYRLNLPGADATIELPAFLTSKDLHLE